MNLKEKKLKICYHKPLSNEFIFLSVSQPGCLSCTQTIAWSFPLPSDIGSDTKSFSPKGPPKVEVMRHTHLPPWWGRMYPRSATILSSSSTPFQSTAPNRRRVLSIKKPCELAFISRPREMDGHETDRKIKASLRGFLILSTRQRFGVVDWNGIEELEKIVAILWYILPMEASGNGESLQRSIEMDGDETGRVTTWGCKHSSEHRLFKKYSKS